MLFVLFWELSIWFLMENYNNILERHSRHIRFGSIGPVNSTVLKVIFVGSPLVHQHNKGIFPWPKGRGEVHQQVHETTHHSTLPLSGNTHPTNTPNISLQNLLRPITPGLSKNICHPHSASYRQLRTGLLKHSVFPHSSHYPIDCNLLIGDDR